jgi:hypothetical protein
MRGGAGSGTEECAKMVVRGWILKRAGVVVKENRSIRCPATPVIAIQATLSTRLQPGEGSTAAAATRARQCRAALHVPTTAAAGACADDG